ncbi:uncharacterized protein ACA1_083310 [Acanthamoeba castellanii str. Neff]|uniref:Uncharacterized protein n=1 Tax=Acanthamoeba castellanii (strain ATCC 30010 / Neff) TaxID=1257118 RepID=L8HED1_ACACF|nr:uncharacterized protein ACA1_083310 [Acanthamoeba castellanii str. Neff]ELR23103.1 hypothetical protein ACA1_083310 [Acanthamoeba castellanii str. Neff]
MCLPLQNYFTSVAEVEKNKAKLTELQTIPETQEQEAEKNSTTGASSTTEMSQDLLRAPENKVSEDNIHILMWGWNHMHNEADKDEWEDFFQYHDTLCTDKFWTTTQGEQAIDWKKLISSMPEAKKLNKAEQRKLQENLHNYTGIMKKFLNVNSWPKSAAYLENLYAESKEPMPITPLYLCNHLISDPILLHVLKHISTEQHKQIQAGNKYKISKNAFKELLIACQRCVEFLSKARKVATHLMDRDFIHLKNKVATGEWEQLLLILSNPHIKIEDIIQELQERIQKEKEEKEKAEEKEKHKAKDCFAAVLTTNVLEMAALLNLLAKENSPWQLLHLISGSIPNIHSKSARGVQHNGYHHPKLMAYKKPSLIKRWNPKWVHIAPQVHQLSHVFYQLVLTAYTSSTKA